MKKRTILILLVLIMIFGFFFGLYSRQPLGFMVLAAALIAFGYFVIKD